MENDTGTGGEPLSIDDAVEVLVKAEKAKAEIGVSVALIIDTMSLGVFVWLIAAPHDLGSGARSHVAYAGAGEFVPKEGGGIAVSLSVLRPKVRNSHPLASPEISVPSREARR